MKTAINPISILDLEFDRNLDKLPSDAAKASEIAHAISYEISQRQTENPVFYASLKERLEKIIQQKQTQRIDDREELQQLVNLKDEIRSGISTAAENLDLDKTSYAFYQLLEENEIDRAISRDFIRFLD